MHDFAVRRTLPMFAEIISAADFEATVGTGGIPSAPGVVSTSGRRGPTTGGQ
jgi:hypothetical protein